MLQKILAFEAFLFYICYMNNIRGIEFHSIIQKIFGDVKGLNVSEQLQVNCPRCAEREGLLHSDDKFNLEINTAKRKFRCWKCDEPKFSGSLSKLIRIYGNNSDYEIYKSYAGSFSDYDFTDEDEEIIIKLPSEMILFSQMDVNNPDHFEAYNYLVCERKIDREMILKYRLGFCVDGKYEKRIIIPSYDKNGVVNYFVARNYDKYKKNIKDKYLNPKANKGIIFNEGFIDWDSTIYIGEGVFDIFSLPNAIPLLGKTIFETLFIKLKEIKPNIVIVLDPDAYTNAIELYYTLANAYVGYEDRVRIVKLPTKKDDVDEIRRNQGIEEVVKCLYGARKLTTDDYFTKKLQKPYVRGNGRYDSYSKYFERGSGSTRNYI